jgi:hypothetical protein
MMDVGHACSILRKQREGPSAVGFGFRVLPRVPLRDSMEHKDEEQ